MYFVTYLYCLYYVGVLNFLTYFSIYFSICLILLCNKINIKRKKERRACLGKETINFIQAMLPLPVPIKTLCFSLKSFFSLPLSPETFHSSFIISLKNISPCLWLFSWNFDYTGNISVYLHSQLANKKVRLKEQTFRWILHYKNKFWMVYHPLTPLKSIQE